MEQPITITPEQAWQMMNNGAHLLDVRDELRFTQSHAKGAFHLTNQSYGQFQNNVDFDENVIVMCYHGISSLNVGAYLLAQGYDNIYSVIGGFEGWEKSGLPLEN